MTEVWAAPTGCIGRLTWCPKVTFWGGQSQGVGEWREPKELLGG